MVDWSSLMSSAFEFISNWWTNLPSETKWSILIILLIALIVVWFVMKAINTIAKILIVGLIIGGIIFLLVDQTDHLSFWITIFPSWENYVWEKGGVLILIGLILLIMGRSIILIAKKTLRNSRTRNGMSPKKCVEMGGIYNENEKTCVFNTKR